MGWRISGNDEVAGIDSVLHSESAYSDDGDLTALEAEQDAAGVATKG
jgi:hypothetical protein